MRELPIETVLAYLRYDEPNGKLFWLERTHDMFRYNISDASLDMWNAENAGNEAGCTDALGYIRIELLGKSYFAHRLIWAVHHGEWPKQIIDHIDGDTGHNHFTNLRDVSNATNLRNARLYSSNKSGCHGVVWKNRDKRWESRIKVDGEHIHLGTFTDLDEAVVVRKSAEKKYGFHENHGVKLSEGEA